MPKVVIMCEKGAYQRYPHQRDLDRLASFADVVYVPCQSVDTPDPVVEGVNAMPKSAKTGRGPVAINGGHVGYGAAGEIIAEGDKTAATIAALEGADVVIVAPGAPRITGEMLSKLPQLRMIGDLEGDRFANRVDVEAAFQRRISVVDTTQGTSYPVSEWALALAMIALKNAGADFRRMISGQQPDRRAGATSELGQEDLWGKDVGLVGCGFMGRRLLDLLKPFQCSVYVYDPYLPREAADMLGFTQTSLEKVMTMDVVISLVPQTPATDKLIGAEQIALMKPGAAFVNVSRGAVVDTDALVARLQKGDISAGLDVFDPEPVPPDHPITKLPNVFLSPHSASRTRGGGNAMFSLMVDEVSRVLDGHMAQFQLTPAAVANRHGKPPPKL